MQSAAQLVTMVCEISVPLASVLTMIRKTFDSISLDQNALSSISAIYSAKTHAAQARQILLPSRLYYAKMVTDFSDKLLLDLAMSGNRGRCAVERVAKDSVLRAFPNEDAAVRFYVPDEVGSFHESQAARRTMRSRVTLALVEKLFSKYSRLTSRIN